MSKRTLADWQKMNDPVIAAFRENAGKVPGRLKDPADHAGPRVNRAEASARLATAWWSCLQGGSPSPDWCHNLVANPEVTIEHAGETFRARAYTAEEPERTRLFDQQAALMPFFDGYRKQVSARRSRWWSSSGSGERTAAGGLNCPPIR